MEGFGEWGHFLEDWSGFGWLVLFRLLVQLEKWSGRNQFLLFFLLCGMIRDVFQLE